MLISLLLWIHSLYAIDYSSIPPAHNIEESKTRFNQRLLNIAEESAKIPAGPFIRSNNGRFLATAIARLYLKQNVDEINRVLEDPNTVAYAKYGTDIVIVPKICQRTGDYDFSLVDLVRVAYLGKNQLTQNAKNRMVENLLSAKGDKHFSHFWLGICGRHKDSENHILMTETSRYLTNQLIKEGYSVFKLKDEYDNSKNGFPEWMTKHLNQFFRKGFEEYNSKPYEGYTIKAIDNLYSYSYDENVKTTAQSLLDLLSATFAIQSNGMRRLPPWRRQPKHLGKTSVYSGDNSVDRFTILAGNYHFFQTLEKPFDFPVGEGIALPAGTSPYRVPDLILDLIVNNDHKTYFQGFRHMGAELYSSGPHALLSAGGTYINTFDFGTKERDGLPSPITIMFSKDITSDIRNFFRIEGHKDLKHRNNLCVTRNFACGLNIKIPSYIPITCQEKIGDWTLFNFSNKDCPYHWGVHLAVLSKNADSKSCRKAGDNYGLIEIREESEISYSDFKTKVLANPTTLNCSGISRYITTSGLDVNFEILPKKNYYYPITQINKQVLERDYRKWKRAFGDIINSNNEGTVFEIKNPYMRQKLTLDVSTPTTPKRFVTSY